MVEWGGDDIINCDDGKMNSQRNIQEKYSVKIINCF